MPNREDCERLIGELLGELRKEYEEAAVALEKSLRSFFGRFPPPESPEPAAPTKDFGDQVATEGQRLIEEARRRRTDLDRRRQELEASDNAWEERFAASLPELDKLATDAKEEYIHRFYPKSAAARPAPPTDDRAAFRAARRLARACALFEKTEQGAAMAADIESVEREIEKLAVRRLELLIEMMRRAEAATGVADV